MKKATSTVALAAAALCGCASMHPGEGFDGVQSQVRSRTGATIRWDRGTEEDQEARRAVDRLLAQELTVDGAVQVALLNNRGLQATYEDLDIAQADLVRAGLLRNPLFSGEVRLSTSGQGLGVALDVTEDFLSLLTMPLHKALAGAGFEAAKARVTRVVVDHALRVRGAFYAYQAAEATRGLRAKEAEAAAASYELAKRLREAGNIRELDLLTHQSLLEKARLDASAADAGTLLARETLNTLMGAWGAQTAWRAAPHLPALPPEDEDTDDSEKRAVASSLELAEARAQVDQAAAGARLSRPLAWLAGSTFGAAADRETEGGWSVGPSLSIPIPIFDSGGAAAGEGAARLRQAADRYYAKAVDVRAQARACAAAAQAARRRVMQYQGVILPLHEKILEQAQLQYNAMQASAFQLLQAKREQIDAEVESVGELRGYWQARAELLSITSGGDGPHGDATGTSMDMTGGRP